MMANEILAKRTAEADERIQQFWNANPDLLALAKEARDFFGGSVTCSYIGPIRDHQDSKYVPIADTRAIPLLSRKKGRAGSFAGMKWGSK